MRLNNPGDNRWSEEDNDVTSEEGLVECPSTATRDTYQPFRIVAATVRSSGLAASAAGVGRLALKYRARTGPQELRNLTDEQGADRLFRRAAIQGTCGNV